MTSTEIMIMIEDTMKSMDFENNAPDCTPGDEAAYLEELEAELAAYTDMLLEECCDDELRDLIQADRLHPQCLERIEGMRNLSSDCCASFERLTGCEMRY